MSGYTKLFNSILHSTIWQEPNETKILWITMLAMCDKHGEVHASIPGLARLAGITIEQAESGIARFMSPDKFSRSKEFEGKGLVDRHRLVYGFFGSAVGAEIHAMSLKTLTPAEAGK